MPKNRNKYFKNWNKKNKETRAEIQARYYEKHKEKITAYRERYYIHNRAELLRKQRAKRKLK